MKIAINLASQPFRRDRAMVVASILVCLLLVASLGVLIHLANEDNKQLGDVRHEVAGLKQQVAAVQDQQAKLKPILENESQQTKALHDDTSLAPADKRAKMKELHESSTEKINAVLTPDQQTKWKQMKQEMMEKHKGMKSQGQMDQPQ